ncbi:MAG: ABC transporter permease [Candidatus Zhuqueibacterota bacterium]
MIEFFTLNKTLFLRGELITESVTSALASITHVLQSLREDVLEIDLSEVTNIDSAGVALLDEIKTTAISSGLSVQFIRIPEKIDKAIASFSTEGHPISATQETPLFLERMGEGVYAFSKKAMDLLYLTADIFYWSIIGLVDRKGQRAGSFVQQSVLIGVNAFQIVGLISFLIGLILALQSAAQLRQFGANIFVADLIGIAMLREMGPIMTAIAVAGRSGSAIASEIATMVVTEEIDALKTMALNPIRFVIVPKFHAITLTMPLLTILADLVGILGGFVIGVTYLQLSGTAFFNELLTVLILKDVLTGLFKSVIFAWIIMIIACYQGLNVTGGAEGVGRATTASVVASIFFVIVADSILGLIFYFGQ